MTTVFPVPAPPPRQNGPFHLPLTKRRCVGCRNTRQAPKSPSSMTLRSSSTPSIVANSMAAAGLRRLSSSSTSGSRGLAAWPCCFLDGSGNSSGDSSSSWRTCSGVIPEARPTSAASCHPLSDAAMLSTASSLVRASAVSTRLASRPRDSMSARSAVMTGVAVSCTGRPVCAR